ncbi:DsbA family oxidoreductase [Sporosarcina sp. BI001-red]|uniref:DsbA family oxidoreductase n=1 Tax=Sporosarcina sp. BI001-red TaxID=2282866 RepID=UPI000E22A46F|nr:DsbA family oxidoreductase [Sporosarcina sp. BI001-red]REB05526.1 DsbA family oxidoreductase [Sporosarcina sp. BI001-red]
MKIEIWSDYVCPFCYIGKRKLELALDEIKGKDRIDIEFKSFQLDPDSPKYNGQDFYESMGAKFGGAEKAKQMMGSIVEQAKEVGLEFNFDTMKPTNTFDAHRMTKFAKVHGKDAVLAEKLLYANFTQSKDVGNEVILVELAVEAGLSKEEALAVASNPEAYADEVRADIEEAKQLGVTGVPFFVFNRKYAISGAQPPEAFLQAMEKILEEEKPVSAFQNLSPDNGVDATCTDGSCAVPEEKK